MARSLRCRILSPSGIGTTILASLTRRSLTILPLSLVCYLAGVATNHETSYKHAGQLKYIDYGGNIVEPEKLRHVIYLHLAGLFRLKVIFLGSLRTDSHAYLQVFKHFQRDTWLRLGMRMFLPFFMNDHVIW